MITRESPRIPTTTRARSVLATCSALVVTAACGGSQNHTATPPSGATVGRRVDLTGFPRVPKCSVPIATLPDESAAESCGARSARQRPLRKSRRATTLTTVPVEKSPAA